MKLLVISDSHGNIANLKHVIGFAKKYKIKAIIHAGDWNTVDSAEAVLSAGIPLYTVFGNADISEDLEKCLRIGAEGFVPDFLKFEVGGRKIGITHKPTDVKKFFKDQKMDIVFCGHYHSKDESTVGGLRVARPGAIVSGMNFAVYETETNEVEFIEDE